MEEKREQKTPIDLSGFKYNGSSKGKGITLDGFPTIQRGRNLEVPSGVRPNRTTNGFTTGSREKVVEENLYDSAIDLVSSVERFSGEALRKAAELPFEIIGMPEHKNVATEDVPLEIVDPETEVRQLMASKKTFSEPTITLKDKPIFFVFLNLEDTIISRNFARRYLAGVRDFRVIPKLDPSCADAFLRFIKELEVFYDTRLVITSTIYRDNEEMLNYLQNNEFDYGKSIFFAKILNSRGRTALEYMRENGQTDFSYHRLNPVQKALFSFKGKDFSNFIIIDGVFEKDYRRYFPKDRIAHVHKDRGFTIEEAERLLAEILSEKTGSQPNM